MQVLSLLLRHAPPQAIAEHVDRWATEAIGKNGGGSRYCFNFSKSLFGDILSQGTVFQSFNFSKGSEPVSSQQMKLDL